ncbi:MAG: DMT family transporter [Clostridia bacterium]|nr:DMT family transporter [Clostridia bacterium]
MDSSGEKAISYIGLFFVVFVWGCSPLLTLELYKYYSPTARMCFSELTLFIAYLIIAKNHIKEFNMSYIKVGVPTGIFMALANLCQKIGLLYTTPAKYAFLENLSCITVPVLMYILVKKKPKISTLAGSILCLLSALVLNGTTLGGQGFGIGEILCAIAGLLYGFNIAGTGVYAKNLNVPLYLATQAVTGFIVSLISTVVFDFTSVEKIVFSIKPVHIIFAIAVTLIVSALCWIIRTNSMKHIDACIVAVIMPFSAVITSIVSVISGKDTLNINLIFGGFLGLLAIFLSSYEDIKKGR